MFARPGVARVSRRGAGCAACGAGTGLRRASRRAGFRSAAAHHGRATCAARDHLPAVMRRGRARMSHGAGGSATRGRQGRPRSRSRLLHGRLAVRSVRAVMPESRPAPSPGARVRTADGSGPRDTPQRAGKGCLVAPGQWDARNRMNGSELGRITDSGLAHEASRRRPGGREHGAQATRPARPMASRWRREGRAPTAREWPPSAMAGCRDVGTLHAGRTRGTVVPLRGAGCGVLPERCRPGSGAPVGAATDPAPRPALPLSGPAALDP
jgi:hypothetical protein